MITYDISPYKRPGVANLFANFNTGNWRDFLAYIIDMDEYTIEDIRKFKARAERLYERTRARLGKT